MTNVMSEIPHEANKSRGQIEEWLDGLHEIGSYETTANALDEALSAFVVMSDEVRKNAIAH